MFSEATKDFLRAAVLAGVTTAQYRARDQIIAQMLRQYRPLSQLAIGELMEPGKECLRRGPAGSFYFTQEGALRARDLLTPEPLVPTPPPRRVQGRGATNVQMEEYAEATNVAIWSGQRARCSFCGHQNDHGLKSGPVHLCQVCFRKGRRF